jgi:putative heme-binding domain-containing protein
MTLSIPNSARRVIWSIWFSCAMLQPFCPAQAAGTGTAGSISAAGKRSFTSTCAGCHGLDGRGSERAPSIATSPRIQKLSDKGLSNIISNGVPGTGMPAFHSLSAAQVLALVSYIRTLQGKTEARVLPGNAARGKDVFFGKGECSNCHSIAGHGGFLGPDLTSFGASSSAESISEAISRSTRIVPFGYRPASAITRDGTNIEGVVRNEDNFTVQLQTQDGAFHFFQKSDLQKLEYRNQSLMPANYAERLSHDELNDLVSYLIDASSSKDKPTKRGPKEDDAE